MAGRVYVVPVIGTGASSHDARRPKYFTDGFLPAPVVWGGTDYGFEPWMFVYADLNATDEAAVIAQPDSYVFPVNLDALLTSAQVTGVQNKLEVINIPADWVDVTDSWRDVLKRTLGTVRFMCRFAVVFAKVTGSTTAVFTSGVNLARTIGSLSLNVRNALTQTATEFGLNTSAITGASTIRDLFNTIGPQMAIQPMGIGSLVL